MNYLLLTLLLAAPAQDADAAARQGSKAGATVRKMLMLLPGKVRRPAQPFTISKTTTSMAKSSARRERMSLLGVDRSTPR
jgi:hypothetical protein